MDVIDNVDLVFVMLMSQLSEVVTYGLDALKIKKSDMN